MIFPLNWRNLGSAVLVLFTCCQVCLAIQDATPVERETRLDARRVPIQLMSIIEISHLTHATETMLKERAKGAESSTDSLVAALKSRTAPPTDPRKSRDGDIAEFDFYQANQERFGSIAEGLDRLKVENKFEYAQPLEEAIRICRGGDRNLLSLSISSPATCSTGAMSLEDRAKFIAESDVFELFEILSQASEMEPRPEAVAVICTYLTHDDSLGALAEQSETVVIVAPIRALAAMEAGEITQDTLKAACGVMSVARGTFEPQRIESPWKNAD